MIFLNIYNSILQFCWVFLVILGTFCVSGFYNLVRYLFVLLLCVGCIIICAFKYFCLLIIKYLYNFYLHDWKLINIGFITSFYINPMMVFAYSWETCFCYCDLYEPRSAYYHGFNCYFTIDMPIFEHIGNHDICIDWVYCDTYTFPGGKISRPEDSHHDLVSYKIC